MNPERDPMLGSAAEQEAYRKRIASMIQEDVEVRRAQRQSEFDRSRNTGAPIQGASGVPSGESLAIQLENSA